MTCLQKLAAHNAQPSVGVRYHSHVMQPFSDVPSPGVLETSSGMTVNTLRGLP